MQGTKSMYRFQYHTESRELAQCCGHGVLNVATPQFHRPAGAKNKPALSYNWAGCRHMLLTSMSLDAKHLDRRTDCCSWVSSFLWVLSQNSAMML